MPDDPKDHTTWLIALRERLKALEPMIEMLPEPEVTIVRKKFELVQRELEAMTDLYVRH